MKLYEELAEDITKLISQGVLRSGERIPSVREMSANRNVSTSTVFQAYYLLEANGLISARDRSGYYITSCASALSRVSNALSKGKSIAAQTEGYATNARESSLSGEGNSNPWKSEFINPQLYPLNKLNRSLASVLQRIDPCWAVRDEGLGDLDLRRQIALRYQVSGVSVGADDVMITNGGLEALDLCLKAVTRPGDTVLIESPTSQYSLLAVKRNGLRAVEVHSEPCTGVNLTALEIAIRQHLPKACLLMTNFQNPLGSLMPREHKKRLVELVTRYKVPLIEDDVYGELYFGQLRPIQTKDYDKEGWVLLCSSFSKCLAPGYRVGWTVPGRFKEELAGLKSLSSPPTSLPAQKTISIYLSKGGFDKHLRHLRLTLEAQKEEYVKAVSRYFPVSTRIAQPQGGYFLWVQLPSYSNGADVYQCAFECGLNIISGDQFSDTGNYQNCLRLNYGHPLTEKVDAALATLGKLANNPEKIWA